jgi:hypothetical protein
MHGKLRAHATEVGKSGTPERSPDNAKKKKWSHQQRLVSFGRRPASINGLPRKRQRTARSALAHAAPAPGGKPHKASSQIVGQQLRPTRKHLITTVEGYRAPGSIPQTKPQAHGHIHVLLRTVCRSEFVFLGRATSMSSFGPYAGRSLSFWVGVSNGAASAGSCTAGPPHTKTMEPLSPSHRTGHTPPRRDRASTCSLVKYRNADETTTLCYSSASLAADTRMQRHEDTRRVLRSFAAHRTTMCSSAVQGST